MRKCKKFKKVYSEALGRKVRRCADFGNVGLSQPTGRKCKKTKLVYSPRLGRKVRRCADFGTPPQKKSKSKGDLSGVVRHCIRYQRVDSPHYGKKIARCSEYAEGRGRPTHAAREVVGANRYPYREAVALSGTRGKKKRTRRKKR